MNPVFESRRREAGGFSLVELLVALAVMAIVVVHALSVLSTQQKSYHGQEQAVAAQADVRLAGEIMLADLRMAGFMVSRFAGVSTVDGGAAAADALCVSVSDGFDEGILADARGRFDRAVVATEVLPGDGSVSITSGHADVDADGALDFVVGRGLILSDGDSSHCAEITSVSASSIGFSPPAPTVPAGFQVAASTGRVVPAVRYEVTASGLERNGDLLSRHVEDFQVEMGLDLDGNGVVAGAEFPVHTIAVADVDALRVVQLSVLTRGATADAELNGPGRQALGNRSAAGTPDNFRRRLAVMTAAPRNLR